jgi:ribosomal protein S21
MRPFNKREKKISGTLTVTAEELGSRYSAELLVKRFSKKVRDEGIMDEIRERLYHKKPSELRRESKQRRQRVIDKVNRERNELFNFTGRRKPTKTAKTGRNR